MDEWTMDRYAVSNSYHAKKTANFIEECKNNKLGFTYPILLNDECKKAWELRKAALGILSNQKGDFQPTNLIEDCAVSPEDLPDYIDELEILLKNINFNILLLLMQELASCT